MPERNALPKRTIEELVAIHSVEGALHSIIVEGPSDRSLVEWFLSENGKTNFAVYEVGLFQVDATKVLSLGLEDNNRGRVITLATGVADRSKSKAKVSCIVDRDFDRILEIKRTCDLLLLTDYTCMIMYTFSPRILGKYLRFHARGFKKSASKVIEEISEALQALFALRLAKHVLRLGLKPVKWQDCCAVETDGVTFDSTEYLNRCLDKSASRSQKPQLLGQIQECRRWMKFDVRHHVRGHDFIEILIWYISQHPGFGAFARRRDEAVEAELFSCIELRDLSSEQLFQKLLTRIDA